MYETTKKRCAYCGVPLGSGGTRDHVFPQNLYPPMRRATYSPITVPACRCCNAAWSDLEAHFRNVINSAGEFNQAAAKLYSGKIKRSFDRPDRKRRIYELLDITEPIQVAGKTRLKIYPARDPRVLDVIRKIVVGLCYHHGLAIALNRKRIWVDVLRVTIPPGFLSSMNHEHCEADIVQYWYSVLPEKGLHSVWVFRFFERTPFIAVVSESDDGSFPWETIPS